MPLLLVLMLVAHTAVGLGIARRVHARDKYRAMQLTRCASTCPSRNWSTPRYRERHCNCGYLKFDTWPYYGLALMWIPFIVWIGVKKFVTGGEYEPKEVKAARRAEELEQVREEFEARTRALEVAAGIRKS